jgi:uncharacterized protein YuzE
MAEKKDLIIHYDAEADLFWLASREPYQEQDEDEIAEGVVARMNPETGEIEALEILWLAERCRQDGEVRLEGMSATLGKAAHVPARTK